MGTSCPDHFLRTRISPMFIPWNPGAEDLASSSRIGSASASTKYRDGLRRLLQGVRRAGLAEAARQQPVGRRHSGARAVRVRQGQARGAHHDRVLRQRDPRDGRRERARETDGASPARSLPQVRRPEQAEQFKTFQQLRRAAAARGVPDRVLGARRGEAAADAAGAGVQPQDRRRRRRRQRHRPRGRAADRQARRPRRRRRREHGGRGRDGAGRREALERGDGRRRRRWT